MRMGASSQSRSLRAHRESRQYPRPIAVVNDIDPSPYPDFNAAARGTVTSPVDSRLRLPAEWVNCTDYRYRTLFLRTRVIGQEELGPWTQLFRVLLRPYTARRLL